MKYKILATDINSHARCGILSTAHGDIQTPIFMPVGTVGSVKGVLHRDLVEDVKAQIILGNTYHLYLRPGVDIIQQARGLHKFIAWDKPILTDSGGYQIFSLTHMRKLTDMGCEFRSHIDGSKHLFTPENVVDIQRAIGADIIMALDECPPGTADYDYAKKSLQLTQSWLERGIQHFRNTEPHYGYELTFFPIIQGCVYADLRRAATEHVLSFDTDGVAIGGLAVGEPAEQMYEILEVLADILPSDKPRYLMGVGTPENILEAIARGVDMFDCVMPTRNGRNATIFTSEGIINLRNKKWANDFSPLDPAGVSFVDGMYSKAYLRHLFVAGEMLGPQIASLHNLAFYLWLMENARTHITQGDFISWKNSMVKKMGRRL